MQEPVAWLITYGDRHDHQCVVLDRGRAEQTAAQLHGVLAPLVVDPEFLAQLAKCAGNFDRKGAAEAG